MNVFYRRSSYWFLLSFLAMNAGPDRCDLNELRLKLVFLVSKKALRIHGHGNQKQLAAASGIKESTFKTLKSAVNKDRISADQERGLAKACGFRIDWPEWREGTAKDFATRYLEEIKPRKASNSEGRRHEIPLTARYGEQKTKDGRLASMKMRVLSNTGVEWRIWIDLYCRAVDGYGICRGFVTLHCGEALADRDDANFKQICSVDGANAALRLSAGTDRARLWEVRALAKVLDDDICPNEHYGIVKKLAEGDTVKVSFSVYVKDVPSTDPYVRRPDGKPVIGRNSKLILDRIGALDLLDGKGENGEVVLCGHEVAFENTVAVHVRTETDETWQEERGGE